MRTLLLYCLTLCLSTIGMAQNSYKSTSIQILPNSELTITGDTNINSFQCEFNTRRLERTRPIEYKVSDNHVHFKNAVLKLNNEGFDCGNKAINKDFHALLQTEEYPEITLELTEIHIYDEKSANAYVRITIAGKKKDYSLPIDVVTSPVESYVGKLKVNINDFELKPPRKMFGIIVVKEDIEITFNLAVKK